LTPIRGQLTLRLLERTEADGGAVGPLVAHLWGVVALGLIALVFFLPVKWWALAAAGGFGVMEGIGLHNPNDPYPPLTHVIRQYVPRWAAFTAIYGFTGAAGGVWFRVSSPERLGALFALLGWFTTHFDVTFDKDKVIEERIKRQRIIAGVARVLPFKRS
jgi:hypothetical protein